MRRESERIKKLNLTAAALKLNQDGDSLQSLINKKRLKHKKQMLSRSLEKQQLLKKCHQDVKDKIHSQIINSKTVAKQKRFETDRPEENVNTKQKNTNAIKSSVTGKKKTYVQKSILKKKCRLPVTSNQSKEHVNCLTPQNVNSKMSINQKMFEVSLKKDNLNIKQKSTKSVKSSVPAKRKMGVQEKCVPKKKCRLAETSHQNKQLVNQLTRSQRINSKELANQNMFKIGRSEEILNIKEKSTNALKNSATGKKKTGISIMKSKYKLRKTPNESKILVMSHSKNVDKLNEHKSGKKKKTCISNRQKIFAKVDADLVSAKRLRNQQTRKNEKPRKSKRQPLLTKSSGETKAVGKGKRRMPKHEAVCQNKMKNVPPPSQKVKSLRRQHLKALPAKHSKQKQKTALKHEDTEDEEFGNLPLTHMRLNRTFVKPDSNLSRPKDPQRCKVKREKRYSMRQYALKEIGSEKKRIQTGQKKVKKYKDVQQDKVINPLLPLDQSTKDLKIKNSRSLQQKSSRQKSREVPSTIKNHLNKKTHKENAVIKHHVISSCCRSTQTDMSTIETGTQTDFVSGLFTVDETTSKNKHIFKDKVKLDVHNNSVESIMIKNTSASLSEIVENPKDFILTGSENKGNISESKCNFEALGPNKDFNKNVSFMLHEENKTVCSESLNEEKLENNTENAQSSQQNSYYSDVKYVGISQKKEEFCNPQDSRAECQIIMKNGELLGSEEQPKIVRKELALDSDEYILEAQTKCKSSSECSHAESASVKNQTKGHFMTEQGNSLPKETVKVEVSRDDYSLQQHKPTMKPENISYCNSYTIQKQDTVQPSISCSNVEHNHHALISQGEQWLYRSAAFSNGYSVTQYVAEPYSRYILDNSFALNIQQSMAKLAENISQQPLQQISPQVFIYDPLANTNQ